MKKRLIVCSDGTWQTLNQAYPTNVVKIAQAITPVASKAGSLIPQVLFYDAGIGTEPGQKVIGGAFGLGIDEKILNAYRFLCLNYCPDDEIYLFGFSRGAYTVRSLAGMISHCGLLPRHRIRDSKDAYALYRNREIQSRDDHRAESFRQEHDSQIVKITLLGCWDTVGALGIPDLLNLPQPLKFLDPLQWEHRKYEFHNTTLNQVVQHALHAVAIDEHRKIFQVTPMQMNPKVPEQTLKQVWFPGDHGCIGGGTESHRNLSDGALKWMIEEIGRLGLGLEFKEEHVQYDVHDPRQNGIHPDPTVPFLVGNEFELGFAEHYLRTVDSFAALHDSVKIRWRDRQDYRPTNLLDDYRRERQHVTEPIEQLLNQWSAAHPSDRLTLAK